MINISRSVTFSIILLIVKAVQVSLMVSVVDSHPCGPGSIPSAGKVFFTPKSNKN